MVRPVTKLVKGISTMDGSGVQLKRVLGTAELDHLDPFLLLDEFKSRNPDDYIGGFPPHPHRGFETVTYLIHGRFRHKDSRGNEGLLTPGSVQWMTAGRGIIHSEMPEMKDGLLWGFQLWANLPGELKMIEPGYQDIPAKKIPEVEDNEVSIRVISGMFRGTRGPALTRTPITYFDVYLSDSGSFDHPVPPGQNSFCYLYEGVADFGPEDDAQQGKEGEMVVFGDGDSVLVRTDDRPAKSLFLAADPLNEPVVRRGPFVMNTLGEIRQAFFDYQNGTFDK